MRIYILWTEDANIAKLCWDKESAISYIKEHNETEQITESRHSDVKMSDGRHLYDLELEAGTGARYRLEEMEIDSPLTRG